MAKFGVDVTNMSPADTKAAKFVSPGVEDRSSAIGIQAQTGLIQDVAGIGGALYEGAALGESMNKADLAVEAYAETSPTALNRQLKELGEKKSQLTPEDVEGLDLIDKQSVDLINKFSLASKQGAMSSDDIKVRIEADVRKLSNKWGMTTQVMKQYDQALKLAGLEGLMSGDEALRRSQQQSRSSYEAYIFKEAAATKTTLAMLPDNMGVDFEGTHKKINKVLGEEALIEGANRKATFTAQDLTNNGYPYLQAVSKKNISYMIELAKSPDMTADKMLTSVRAVSLENLSTLRGKMQTILHKPEAQAYLKIFEEQDKAYISLLEKASSKEDMVNKSNNMLKILQNDDVVAYHKAVGSPAQLEGATKLLAALGPGVLVKEDSPLLIKTTRMLENMVRGVAASQENEYDVYKPNSESKSILAVDAIKQFITTAAHEKSTQKDLDQLNKSIATVNMDIGNMDIMDKFMYFRKQTEMFASGAPDNMKGLAKLDASSKSMATNQVTEYTTLLVNDFNNKMKSPELKKETIQIGVIPKTGVLTINVPTNPILQRTLQQQYFKGINHAIQAQMNINGVSDKDQFAKAFFNNYKDKLEGK